MFFANVALAHTLIVCQRQELSDRSVLGEPGALRRAQEILMAQEFTIRAAGADKAALRHLVARFPLAFRPAPGSEVVAQAPDLKRPRESWAMGQMEEAEARPGTRG